jgi:hypothetical protein
LASVVLALRTFIGKSIQNRIKLSNINIKRGKIR